MAEDNIAGQPRTVAKKLAKANLAQFVVGKDSKAGITKNIADKQPILVHDNPEDDAETNDRVFGGGTRQDKTTRRADYSGDESEKAYESFSPALRKVLENAQKMSALSGNHEDHSAIGDDNDGEPIQKIKEKLPAQTVDEKRHHKKHHKKKCKSCLGEGKDENGRTCSACKGTGLIIGYSGGDDDADGDGDGDSGAGAATGVAEGFGSMQTGAPSATSDDPAYGGDALPTQSPDDDDDAEDDEDDDGQGTAKDMLEQIALAAADAYDSVISDDDVGKDVMAKLKIAQNLVSEISKDLESALGDDDDDEAEDDSNEPGTTDQSMDTKPSFNSNATGAMGEAVYSYKAAREGKDIGKPGKNFEKIAGKAAEKYGSKKAGERVAGAILAKIRAKHGVK